MLKFSGLKFAFAVSLLVHGAIFSAVYAVKHRPTGAAPTAASEPASVVEIVAESDQPAAAVPVTPPVTVAKPQPKVTELVPIKPVTASPPSELPKPALEEKARVIPVAIDWELDPAEEPPATADVTEVVAMPATVAAPNAGTSHAAGESVVNRAGYLINPKPAYPPEARKRGQEGLVILHVFVSGEGLPQRVEMAQSSGCPLLDTAALEAVRQWRFVPARLGNTAMASQIEVPIRFKLLDSK
jgi:periplasmic protein TonB